MLKSQNRKRSSQGRAMNLYSVINSRIMNQQTSQNRKRSSQGRD